MAATAEDADAAARFGSDSRRAQFLAGRGLARDLLAAETGVPADAWRFLEDGNGRPYASLGGADAPDVSISHSGPFIAAALTNAGRVGIDIERAGRTSSYKALAAAYLPAREIAAVETGGETAFLRLWTLREAIGKATGGGLSAALAFAGDLIAAGAPPTFMLRSGDDIWVLGSRDLAGCTVSCAVRLDREEPLALAARMQAALEHLAPMSLEVVA